MPEIKINRLNIRLRGVTPGQAREKLHGWNAAFKKYFTQNGISLKGAGKKHIPQLTAGRISVSRNAEWQEQVAQRIFQAIQKQLEG